MPGKAKWEDATGLFGSRGAWAGGGVASIDMSFINVPATTGLQRVVVLQIPPVQTVAAALGSYDSYENPIAVATTSRAVGVYNTPIYVIANPCLVSSTANGTAVKTYAATFTLQLEILSGSNTSAVGVRSTLMTSAYALNGMTNIWTPMTLNNIPAERAVSLTGALVPNAFLMYPGDTLTALYANTAGAGVTVAGGDVLGVSYEVV